MKQMNLSRIIGIPVLALVITGCGREQKEAAGDSFHSVYVVTPVPENGGATSVYSATVEEGKSVNASFKTGGQIRKVMADEGAYVRKGQVLAVLDDVDYRLQLRQLEVQTQQMAGEMKRLDEMFAKGNVAPNDYEKAKAGYEQLKTQLELVKNQLSYATLLAPSSGHIVERYLEEGEMAGAGTPVFRIIDSSSLEASVAVPSGIYAARSGILSCTGRTSLTGDTEIPLEIISFIPDADNNSLFRLRLRIPSSMNKTLTPGVSMSVSIVSAGGEGGGHTVPSRSILRKDGKSYVWTVSDKDSTLSMREVTLAGSHSGGSSTVAGLSGDETIVAAGVRHLSDKEKVKVIGDISELKDKVGL